MPSSRVGLPSDWWVPGIRRGIIRESALWPLCRRRHKGHWTGHERRLARGIKHPYASEGYAREELRAEIVSLIIGSEIGIGYDPTQHAAYVACWIRVLENDPLEIFRAAADAEKIHKYIYSLQQEQCIPEGISLADALEEYDRRVDGPESRKQLEKESPALVEARDKAVVEIRKERIQNELLVRSQSSRSLHR
jgi:Zincin-like metallopeptidase